MRRADPPPPTSLEGHFLIAMPSLRDGPFARSVVYMCAHRADGAMGIVINQRAQDIQFAELLVQLDIVPAGGRHQTAAERGMPCAWCAADPSIPGAVSSCISSDYRSGNSTVKIAEGVCLTATLDILKRSRRARVRRRAVLALGCAGWASGQLESEFSPTPGSSDRWTPA